MTLPHPDPFLVTLLDEREGKECDLAVLHAGFESGTWRYEQFATHILDWLPEFALTYREYSALDAHNAGPLMRKAARKVFDTEDFKRRGEFGEIILHAAVRQVYESVPAISKMFFKDSANDVVKGFDIVHLVTASSEIDLWLGEAKFYGDRKTGLRSAAESLQGHFKADYLRQECTFILDKSDPEHPLHKVLKKLLHENESLDSIISRIVVPVLVTYDCERLGKHNHDSPQLDAELVADCKDIRDWWLKECPVGISARIILFLIPLSTKTKLNESLVKKLKSRQERD